jgi:hypothetical protein
MAYVKSSHAYVKKKARNAPVEVEVHPPPRSSRRVLAPPHARGRIDPL